MNKKTQLNPFAHPTGYKVPKLPDARRLCPTCLNPMHVWYAWWPAERTCNIMYKCDCGNASKGKLVIVQVDKKGRVL